MYRFLYQFTKPLEIETSTVQQDVILFAGLLLLLLSIVYIGFIFLARDKQNKLIREKDTMEELFQEELLKTQIEVQEQTRKNLAADLHDNIGQVLSLTNVTLASINPDDKEKTRLKIEVTQELVTRSIRELRQLSKIINGEQLIKQGLVQTIEQEISWLQRNGHYTVEFTHDLPDAGISNTDKDLFLYRLLQESLNNIIKHSGANTITIHLTYADHSLRLMIADNGIGFNAKEKLNQQGGLGLLNMQKRVALLNGTIEINTAENKGTSIIFSIPYP
jgi:signal transduction histidine kinase